MDAEKKLYGLMAIAEEQQKAVEAGAKALAEERAKLQAEREALKQAVAALQATAQGIPFELQKATKQALSGATVAASEAATKAMKTATAGIQNEMASVKLTASDAANIMRSAFSQYQWKWTAYLVAVSLVLVGGGLFWASILKNDIVQMRHQAQELANVGGKAKIVNCEGRKCIQVEKSAAYGPDGDFYIIKGY